MFALTHNYTGYPLVRRMREMVRAGELGEIRLVQVEYPQDWLTGATEATGNKQAEWRVDPKRSGAGGSLGDIGTHAYNLADYVTGLELAELCRRPHLVRRRAQARRQRADHAALRQRRARRDLGEPGRAGQRERAHAARLRDQGRLPLAAGQSELSLLVAATSKSTRIVTRGGPDAGEAAARVTRIPPGHPEGYLEGFANIYSEVALAIRAARVGQEAGEVGAFPDHRRRRQGPRLRRGGGQVVEGQRQMGEAVAARARRHLGRTVAVIARSEATWRSMDT